MKIYADNAATTQMDTDVLNTMIPYFTRVFGNPSSPHSAGGEALTAVDNARTTIAGILGAAPSEIYFTSGGTEADNWAIRSAAAQGAKKGKKHIISSTFEHHAVLHVLDSLRKDGFEITLLDVHSDGLVRPSELLDAIRPDTALVTIMFANNEIGTVQPVDEIGRICRENGIVFHTDAVQAVGHIPVNVAKQNIDMLSVSAHKFHGPKGVGALYCRRGVPLASFIEGGAQEHRRRGGTENVPGIIGMAAALEKATASMQQDNQYIASLRDKLIQKLCEMPNTRLNGSTAKRLPGIANICFEGIEGEALLLHLSYANIMASSGSACTSESLEPSHVLLAIGLPHEVAHGSLRLSLSKDNTPEQIDYILEKIPPIIEKLRDMSPLWETIQKEEKIWHTANK